MAMPAAHHSDALSAAQPTAQRTAGEMKLNKINLVKDTIKMQITNRPIIC